MSKADKIDALLESAILSFAKEGYAGASLRKIAARADISLGTIHMYYGSKVDLFRAANREVWVEFSHERDDLLDAALAAGTDNRPRIGDIVHALARPIVRRALSPHERERAQLQVIRSLVAVQEQMATDPAAGNSLVRWVAAFAKACPTLSRKDLMWAYGFVLGVIWSWPTIDHRYDDLLCDDLGRGVDDVLDDIVSFCTAGLESLVARRAEATPQGNGLCTPT